MALSLMFIAGRAGAECGYTTLSPSGQGTHRAIYLTDPAGEQTATFDLVWGGMLASLKQNGVEHVVGNHTSNMVQPNWYYFPSATPYQPAGAGDYTLRGSPVPGVFCTSPGQLLIMTGLTDFAAGLSGYQPLPAVRQTLKPDGQPVGDTVPGMYATPYVLTTVARFVPNPAAPPAYYLRLEYKVANHHPTEALPFGHWLRGATPFDHTTSALEPTNCVNSTNCPSASTPYLIAGRYVDGARTNGIAFYVSPQTSWQAGTTAFGSFSTDTGNQSQLASLVNQFWTLSPLTSRQWTLYALVGNWSKALSFAQAGGPAPPTAPTVFQAYALTSTEIKTEWIASPGATGYQLERSSGGGPYSPVAYPTSSPYSDTTVSPGVTYLYQVRAQGPGGLSDASNRDLATTILFTDPYLVARGTTVKAVHLTELRQAVNAVRYAAGLNPSSWTDSPLVGLLIRAVHIHELRVALLEARVALGLFTPVFEDDPLTPGQSVIRKAHVGQLRQGTK